jgi:shikimate kinase/3-dehydroquinate synthase
MNMPPAHCLFLLGLPGSGKSAVGRLVADLLGWEYVDTDVSVEDRAGKSIQRVFAEDGERRFRDLESMALSDAAGRQRVVVATGGGVVGRPANRALMRRGGHRIALLVSPSVALARLTGEAEHASSGLAERPLLAGPDPLLRLHALREQRERFYREADDLVDTDGLRPADVAAHIVARLASRGCVPGPASTPFVRSVRTAGTSTYDAVVQWGSLARLGERLAALHLPPRLHVVSDRHVASLYWTGVRESLVSAGFEPDIHELPPGEQSKSRARLDEVYDWLAGRHAERREAVVALGGGVVGDLAGFAAATYLRGMPFVQVPMTLLAQVDASLGGKVGIDHPQGKNLIGAFHQPRLVLADPAALLTLPSRVRTEGWAEVIKHGAALDTDYFASLEHDVDALCRLSPVETTAAIARSVALKCAVVEGDERESEAGARQLLNFGHTIGHALESVSGYGYWLHGEAVAVGMAAAARIGRRLGITPDDVVERLDDLLVAFGLPTRCAGTSADGLMHAALWDKKVRGGKVRWVLLTALGQATVRGDVPDDLVRDALLEIGAAAAEPPLGRTERARA